MEYIWQPISTVKLDDSEWFILGHSEQGWVRFGKYYVQERRWYYSGTSERIMYSQVMGEPPTHWLPMPDAPTGF